MQKPLQRAILVNVIPPDCGAGQAMAEFDELVRLIHTYGGIVILKIIQKRGRPSAKTFVGEGKAQEIADLVRQLKADVVVINGFLKANQSNHLINIIPCEVLDRFEMILKIFEKHARTPEAKLQLQIAQHKYELPKLFGMGAVLSQQTAGVSNIATSGAAGGRRAARGPGEKILEVKRRHFRDQIKMLEKKLEQFRQVRQMQRQRRKRENFLTIALVGYTNSGKSSLLIALTKKQNVLVEDKLFSTLDTRLGELYVPLEYGAADSAGQNARQAVACGRNTQKILLADTIGFVQNLPPLLFSSFMATLEEVKEADILLHIIDVSDPKMFDKIRVAEDVIAQLGCSNKPCIYVFNKIDAAKNTDTVYLAHAFAKFSPVFASALTREGLNALVGELKGKLAFVS